MKSRSVNELKGELRRLAMSLVVILLVFLGYSCTSNSGKKVEQVTVFPFMEMQVATLHDHYLNGDYTVEEVIKAYLEHIDAIDKSGPALNSIIAVNPDALEIARQLDNELRQGKVRGILHGVPVVLKDNINTIDSMPTTAGSRALLNSFPGEDAFLVSKLREAGAVILGKSNLSEWANFRGELSSSGWSGVGGQTRNPYVLDRNPCGSSSGSAVAVAANLTMVAIGTETNGSIVCPAHANGIVGLKPTLGLISRSGVIPIAWSLDVAGPMGRTVADVAAMLGVLAGVDPMDATTAMADSLKQSDYTIFLDEKGLQGKRIGIFTSPLGANYKVDTLFYKAVKLMEQQGAQVVELEQVVASGTGSHALRVMLHEYKDGLNAYFKSLGDKAPVKSLDELIAFNNSDSISLSLFNQQYLEMANETDGMESEDYRNSLLAMYQGAREEGIDKVMVEYQLDAIIAPTGSPAWITDHTNGDSFHLGSSSPAAWAGYPSITVPMGFVDELPVGISFFGKAWSEPVLIEIAYAYEQATKHRKTPEFIDPDK